jgi:hypothetical protein
MKILEDPDRVGSTVSNRLSVWFTFLIIRQRGSAFSTTASLSGYSNSGSRAGTSLNGSGRQVADQGDGVWVPVPTGSGINYSNLQPQASRVQANRSVSVSSASTTLTETTTSTGTSIAWSGFQQQPRPPRQGPSTRASSVSGGTKAGTNPGFVNIGAGWRQRTAEERAAVTREREQERQREAQQNLHVEDEDSDNESFDGDL